MKVSFQPTKKQAEWKKRFAFFPTRVGYIAPDQTLFVWLESYWEKVEERPAMNYVTRKPIGDSAEVVPWQEEHCMY